MLNKIKRKLAVIIVSICIAIWFSMLGMLILTPVWLVILVQYFSIK